MYVRISRVLSRAMTFPTETSTTRSEVRTSGAPAGEDQSLGKVIVQIGTRAASTTVAVTPGTEPNASAMSDNKRRCSSGGSSSSTVKSMSDAELPSSDVALP